jgi:hypothetical protein
MEPWGKQQSAVQTGGKPHRLTECILFLELECDCSNKIDCDIQTLPAPGCFPEGDDNFSHIMQFVREQIRTQLNISRLLRLPHLIQQESLRKEGL